MRRADLKLVRTVCAPQDASGRPSPRDYDLERVTIGAALDDPAVCDRLIVELEPSTYALEVHEVVFGAMRDMRADGLEVDAATLATWLEDRRQLERVGGRRYIAELAMGAPAVPKLTTYIEQLREKAHMRQMIAELQRLGAEGYGDVGDPKTWLRECVDRIERIGRAAQPTDFVTIAEAVATARASLEMAAKSGALLGIPTGLSSLDRLTGGLHDTDVTYLGAPTSGGKTALATVIMGHAARLGHGVAFFSLEDDADRMAIRMACGMGHVDFHGISKGEATVDDWERLARAMVMLRSLPIVFDASSHLTPSKLKAKVISMRDYFARQGQQLRMVVVDYLQLLDGDGSADKNNREQEIATIGKRIRQMSRDEAFSGITWLVLSQLNEQGKLRESRALEQHACNVFLAQIDQGQDPKSKAASRYEAPPPDGACPAVVRIEKQRRGPRYVDAPMWFYPRFGVFVSDAIRGE